jgi:UDP-N-acetyl-D-glucosamine dehydrogenase
VPTFRENGLAMSSVALEPAAYDCVVIVTDHSGIDYDALVEESAVVVDLRNATGAKGRESDKVWKL